MANNFRIRKRRKGNALLLNLIGDFDGTSAMELICAIEKYTGSTQSILIETDEVNDMHPFGQQVFLKKLPFSQASRKELVFTGKHRSELAL